MKKSKQKKKNSRKYFIRAQTLTKFYKGNKENSQKKIYNRFLRSPSLRLRPKSQHNTRNIAYNADDVRELEKNGTIDNQILDKKTGQNVIKYSAYEKSLLIFIFEFVSPLKYRNVYMNNRKSITNQENGLYIQNNYSLLRCLVYLILTQILILMKQIAVLRYHLGYVIAGMVFNIIWVLVLVLTRSYFKTSEEVFSQIFIHLLILFIQSVKFFSVNFLNNISTGALFKTLKMMVICNNLSKIFLIFYFIWVLSEKLIIKNEIMKKIRLKNDRLKMIKKFK